MKDLYYSTKGFVSCTGLKATGQRILALLFAPTGTFRTVAGNALSFTENYQGSTQGLTGLLQSALSDIITYINRDTPSIVRVEITEVTIEQDKIKISIKLTDRAGSETVTEEINR